MQQPFYLFDLPVHNMTLDEIKNLLKQDYSQTSPKILSTININWVAESFRDPNFRESILASDWVVLDGKPLLWFARYLKYPFTETVPGSTLVKELQDDGTRCPVSIFLLGGNKGVAHLAQKKVNNTKSGIHIVGAINPGFGSVKEISSQKIITEINAAQPDLLLVALGAKKGMEWISYNKSQLNKVKVISHLGATINFLAETVKRAPAWMQNCGLEWLWRILQEPKLFWRYLKDTFTILHFFSQRRR